MQTPTECPVCGGEPGRYRLGTCSPGCDTVLGEPESIVPLVVAALVAVAIIVALVVR